jgi:hypothetical protein
MNSHLLASYPSFFLFSPGTGVTVNAVHPGVARTELGRHTGMHNSAFSSFMLGKSPPSLESLIEPSTLVLSVWGPGPSPRDCPWLYFFLPPPLCLSAIENESLLFVDLVCQPCNMPRK